MPNIKSSKKSVLTTEKKTQQNKAIKTAVKNQIKKLEKVIAEGNKEEATKMLADTFKIIDQACTKGILHLNNAANKKAKLSKKVANIKTAE